MALGALTYNRNLKHQPSFVSRHRPVQPLVDSLPRHPGLSGHNASANAEDVPLESAVEVEVGVQGNHAAKIRREAGEAQHGTSEWGAAGFFSARGAAPSPAGVAYFALGVYVYVQTVPLRQPTKI